MKLQSLGGAAAFKYRWADCHRPRVKLRLGAHIHLLILPCSDYLPFEEVLSWRKGGRNLSSPEDLLCVSHLLPNTGRSLDAAAAALVGELGRCP